MSFVYDTGVLIAADRNDRRVWADHRARLELGFLPTITAPVVAQASRSPRQAPLHRFLRGCRTAPFEGEQAAAVGRLLARTGTSDVVGAHVVITAAHLQSAIITGDIADIGELVAELGQPVAVIAMVEL